MIWNIVAIVGETPWNQSSIINQAEIKKSSQGSTACTPQGTVFHIGLEYDAPYRVPYPPYLLIAPEKNSVKYPETLLLIPFTDRLSTRNV